MDSSFHGDGELCYNKCMANLPVPVKTTDYDSLLRDKMQGIEALIEAIAIFFAVNLMLSQVFFTVHLMLSQEL